jgi:hypothetical protein
MMMITFESIWQLLCGWYPTRLENCDLIECAILFLHINQLLHNTGSSYFATGSENCGLEKKYASKM